MSEQKPISGKGNVTPEIAVEAAERYGTPLYLYDEAIIKYNCHELLSMPNAYGLIVRYAMKANSGRALLQLITDLGLHLDLSSIYEGMRSKNAGVPCEKMMLTSQDPIDKSENRSYLETMIKNGLKYNVCSLRQLYLFADFALENNVQLSMRVHPGVGSGESSTRNTGDKYSCFGVHLTDIEKALEFAESKGLVFDQVHVHIGSGGSPEKWRENIDRELGFVEKYFPYAKTVNFGGGLKEARMPDEKPADIQDLGLYAKKRIEEFYERTGKKLLMEIEPGTRIMANACYTITEVKDKKQTGPDGFEFLVLDGGMEVNSRPLLYGSRHPFYLVSRYGELLSTEFDLSGLDPEKDLRIPVGRCCESGDSQSLDEHHNIAPRLMADPEIGDLFVIGGTGAYCSSMAPHNYNSYPQAPEALLRSNRTFDLIREEQTIDQMTANERPLSRL
ncbi:MAG: diaminopimelate decarboxylase [Candidatus Aenigmarchaeota archaeon]|nr:diaminopimelate decarboxylase [Candidatus Aenigmarchaeota archaeon]